MLRSRAIITVILSLLTFPGVVLASELKDVLTRAKHLPVNFAISVADDLEMVWVESSSLAAEYEKKDGKPRLLLVKAAYQNPAGKLVEVAEMNDIISAFMQSLFLAYVDLKLSKSDSRLFHLLSEHGATVSELPEDLRKMSFFNAAADYVAHVLLQAHFAEQIHGRIGQQICDRFQTNFFKQWEKSFSDGQYPGYAYTLSKDGKKNQSTTHQLLSKEEKDQINQEVFNSAYSGNTLADFGRRYCGQPQPTAPATTSVPAKPVDYVFTSSDKAANSKMFAAFIEELKGLGLPVTTLIPATQSIDSLFFDAALKAEDDQFGGQAPELYYEAQNGLGTLHLTADYLSPNKNVVPPGQLDAPRVGKLMHELFHVYLDRVAHQNEKDPYVQIVVRLSKQLMTAHTALNQEDARDVAEEMIGKDIEYVVGDYLQTRQQLMRRKTQGLANDDEYIQRLKKRLYVPEKVNTTGYTSSKRGEFQYRLDMAGEQQKEFLHLFFGDRISGDIRADFKNVF